MTSSPIARVPAGTPFGGRFTQAQLGEAAGVSLAVSGPALPSPGDIPFENRAQRTDEYNRRYHDIATDPEAPESLQREAARRAVRRVADDRGYFAAISHADEDRVYDVVMAGLHEDDVVNEAVERVGVLPSYETARFGDYLASAVYDIRSGRAHPRGGDTWMADFLPASAGPPPF